MAYSNWIDNTDNTFEELKRKFLSNRELIKDPVTNDDLLNQVDLAFQENQKFELKGSEVTYNYFTYRYEYLKKRGMTSPDKDKRVGLYTTNIILFNYQQKNYYIVDKGYNNTTLGNLRTLCGYESKLEISEKRISGIKTDLFIWMIHHLLDNPGSYLNDDNSTMIESVIGFKGSTSDKLAEISGSGEKIMKMLTTLLFLFENQEISKVEATIIRNGETFKLTLGEKSLVEIDFNSFEGDDFFEIKEAIKSQVAIKTFMDVIPNIISIYSNELDTKKWSSRKETKFFKDIGRDLSKKINEKLRNKNQ